MDNLTLLLAAGCVLLLTIGLCIRCTQRYELAVFLVVFAPWLSVAFLPNADIEPGQETGIGSYLRISLVLLLGFVGLIRFFYFHRDSRRSLPVQFQLLGFFLLFSFVSTVYSIDARFTFIRATTAIAFFAFLLGLRSWMNDQKDLGRIGTTLFITVCFGALVNLASLFLLSDRAWWWSDESRFQGVLGHPNSMGAYCMVSYPIVLWRYAQSRGVQKWLAAAVIAVMSGLLFLTGSRTALVCATFGIATWFIVQNQKAVLVSFMVAILLAVAYVLQFHPERFERKGNEKVTELTGRADFWVAAYQLIEESPLLGYGYAVEGKVWADPRFYRQHLSLWSGSARTSLHNGYVSVAVGGGIGAALVWVTLLFLPAWRCRVSPSCAAKAFVLSMMAICLLHNFAESDFAGVNSPAAVVFWIAWVMAEKVPQESNNQQRFAIA